MAINKIYYNLFIQTNQIYLAVLNVQYLAQVYGCIYTTRKVKKYGLNVRSKSVFRYQKMPVGNMACKKKNQKISLNYLQKILNVSVLCFSASLQPPFLLEAREGMREDGVRGITVTRGS